MQSSEIVTTITRSLFTEFYISESLMKFPGTLYIIVPVTTIAWIITSYITKPTDEQTESFYRQVHPEVSDGQEFHQN